MDIHDLIRAAELLKVKDTESLLRTVKEDEAIKNLFRLMLDTSIVYNITGIPQEHYEISDLVMITSDRALWAHVELLLEQNLIGNKLKQRVQWIYNSCDFHRRSALKWIIERQNPARISVKMCNKIWPGLMYEQLYMGAVPNTDGALDKLPWKTGVMIEVKENGMTMIGFCNGNSVSLRTRNGTDLTEFFPMTCKIIHSAYQDLDIPSGVLMHFEAYLMKSFGVFYSREDGNAQITAQVTNGIKGGLIDAQVCLVALDYYAWDESTTEERFNVMQKIQTNAWMRVVQCWIADDPQDAKDLARSIISEGGEGVICKDPARAWMNGKPQWNVKIKHEFEVELRVVGIKPHSKNPALIGSLECSSEDGLLEVNVGSGLTDEQRSEPWDWWLNSIVTVRSEYITSSKGKKKPSLNNPRLVELRSLEKNKADTLAEIQMQYKASKEN